MLTLDLFNTRHEQELHEGAVDNIIARLIEPLSQRAADIRTHLRNGKLSPAEMKALETEYEDLVQKRLDIIHGRNPAPQDECMGYGTVVGEADDVPVGRMQPGTPEYAAARNRSVKYAGLPDVANKANKMARLNQPGQAGTDVVTPQQRINPNPNKGIIGHAKDWLTGKGGPGREGPTYESELDEQAPPTTVAQGVYNELLKAWTDEKDYLVVPFPDNHNATVTRGQIWNILVTLGQVTLNRRAKYIEAKLNDFDSFMNWISQIKRYKVPAKTKKNAQLDLGIQPQAVAPPVAPQTPVAEAQKKNSEQPDLTGNTARDPIVARELRKIRGRQPGAASDIEALVRDEMDQQARTEQQLAQQESEIDRQQQQLTQLIQSNQTQSSEISSQGREIDNLYKELNRAMGSLKAVDTAPAPKVEPKVEPKTEPAAEPTYTTPSAPPADVPDPATQQKTQKIKRQLSTAKTKLSQPGVSQSAHDALQKTVDSLQAQLDKLNKPAKPVTIGRAGDTAKDMGPAVKANQGELGFDPTPSLDDIIGQHKIQDEPGINQTTKDVINRVRKQKEPALAEGAMGKLDAMRQDLERMSERQFFTAYGISKAAFQQKYRTLLKPALDEDQRLHQGDPIVVTASNEFEGATGEIYDFSPSGKFVVVDLYNHGKHSMHLSDVEYNKYANDDDWYDDELDESANPKLDALIKNIQARVPADAVKRPEIMQRVAQMVAQADPTVADAMATAQQLVQQYGQSTAPIQTDTSGLRKLKPGETHQGINAYNQALGQAPIYKANEGYQDFNKVEPYAVCLAGKCVKKFDYYEDARRYHDNWKQKLYREGNKEKADKITLMPLNLDEAQLNEFLPALAAVGAAVGRGLLSTGIRAGYALQGYGNEEVDEAGSPAQQAAIAIAKKKEQGVAETALNPRDPAGDYAAKTAKKESIGDSSTSTDEAESAILKRIMVAHLDLLKEFGPEKVMQAVEEVAYGVGDVDEIGTSDVSAYVAQVKQILGVPEELDEKWSQKYKSSINCANPKGFSQKAHCAGKKKK